MAGGIETGNPYIVMDGLGRIYLNGTRVMMYVAGADYQADNLPSNGGAAIGKVIDSAFGYKYDQTGKFQASFGLLNDVAVFSYSGGTGGSVRKFIILDAGEKILWTDRVGVLIYPYSTATGFYNNANSFKQGK